MNINSKLFENLFLSNAVTPDKFIIENIERALGFKLYPNQIKYILGEIETPAYDRDRGTGKTTAYCIRLALYDGPPLDLSKPYLFSDAEYCVGPGHRERYSKDIFVRRFMDIREGLLLHGFKVRQVSYPRRSSGGFIVGD